MGTGWDGARLPWAWVTGPVTLAASKIAAKIIFTFREGGMCIVENLSHAARAALEPAQERGAERAPSRTNGNIAPRYKELLIQIHRVEQRAPRLDGQLELITV
jgi:hypothetical protein